MFQPVKVLKGQSPSVAVAAERPDGFLLKKGTEEQVKVVAELAQDLQAPVCRGQTVGTWRLMLGEENLGEFPIRAAVDVPAITLRWAYEQLLRALLA